MKPNKQKTSSAPEQRQGQLRDLPKFVPRAQKTKPEKAEDQFSPHESSNNSSMNWTGNRPVSRTVRAQQPRVWPTTPARWPPSTRRRHLIWTGTLRTLPQTLSKAAPCRRWSSMARHSPSTRMPSKRSARCNPVSPARRCGRNLTKIRREGRSGEFLLYSKSG